MFITNYALTKGIIEVSNDKVRQRTSSLKFFYVAGFINDYVIGKNIFHTREEAVKVAEQMRDKKIEIVKKQLKKLEKMTF